jgi:biopolymer transport protein TolQ
MGNEMSFWSLFWNASALVKVIMMGLMVVSVISWTFIIQRSIALRQAESESKKFERRFWSGIDLSMLYEKLSSNYQNLRGLEAVFLSGFREYHRLTEDKQVAASELAEGCQRAMGVAIARESDQLEAHLSFLATVGSISPYVGLFGTVWGIMQSIMALGGAQQASLAVVAPEIAEALVATAMGLFASIPCVIAYNRFNYRINQLMSRYMNFQDEFVGILFRQASRQKAA